MAAMTFRVIGAGLGRTGTMSLKQALERLLGEDCYHMAEVFGHPEHIPELRRAAEDGDLDWVRFFEGWGASVDWPTCAWWDQIAEAFPDAVILLSSRDSFESWYRSATATIFHGMEDDPGRDDDWYLMMKAAMTAHFTWPVSTDPADQDRLREAYDRHHAWVRAEAPPDRLLEWQPGDGWEPLCERLGVPVPDEPFPHSNSTEDFHKRFGTDAT